jgi:hypothetical protein
VLSSPFRRDPWIHRHFGGGSTVSPGAPLGACPRGTGVRRDCEDTTRLSETRRSLRRSRRANASRFGGSQTAQRAHRIRAAPSGSASSAPSASPSSKHPRAQAAKTRGVSPPSAADRSTPGEQAITRDPKHRYPSAPHAPGGARTPTTGRAGGLIGSGAQSLAAARSGGTTTSVPSSVHPRGQVSTASQGHWQSSGRLEGGHGRGTLATFSSR